MKLGHLGPIETTVRDFAKRHNLHIENRPAGDGLATRLLFAHPAGGQASIDLVPHSASMFELSSVWWEDNHGASARRIHNRPRALVDRTAEATKTALLNELSAILSLKHDDSKEAVGGYADVWGRYSRRELEAMTPKLPFAILDPK